MHELPLMLVRHRLGEMRETASNHRLLPDVGLLPRRRAVSVSYHERADYTGSRAFSENDLRRHATLGRITATAGQQCARKLISAPQGREVAKGLLLWVQ
jgi:hypothetical protein